MSRLGPHRGVRQHELFDRADVPAHVPRLEHYTAVERRRVQHEPRPALWEGMSSWVRQLASIPPSWRRSAAQDERFRKIARTLDTAKIRLCRHDDSLALVEEWLADFRNNDIGTALTRAEIGTLLVEVRNRRTLIALGRSAAKPKGPRLDPARLPLDALDRLIQSHGNMALVDRMRAERSHRLAMNQTF